MYPKWGFDHIRLKVYNSEMVEKVIYFTSDYLALKVSESRVRTYAIDCEYSHTSNLSKTIDKKSESNSSIPQCAIRSRCKWKQKMGKYWDNV